MKAFLTSIAATPRVSVYGFDLGDFDLVDLLDLLEIVDFGFELVEEEMFGPHI